MILCLSRLPEPIHFRITSLVAMLSAAFLILPGCGDLLAAPSGIPGSNAVSEKWPELPPTDMSVEIPAQEWSQRPGSRNVRILIHYPQGTLDSVNAGTGIMLTLHNWGGTDCVGTADPRELAKQLNVVAICVNYLQSGRADSIEAPEPYDCGYLQALDALRSLWFVFDGLQQRKISFASDRIYCTGGSGGGNVTLMANKLAPRTFACVVDLCGMKKLSDDIAFNLPGGSSLNARWSREEGHRNFLSADEQEIRFVGHPGHLEIMKKLGSTARIVTVHGVDDTTCPYADATELVDLLRKAGMDVEPKFVTSGDLDGTIFSSSGHSLGDRTLIVLKHFGKYIGETGEQVLRRKGPTDFERHETIRYPTTNGEFVISYAAGYPTGTFEPSPAPVSYSDHTDLLHWKDKAGQVHPVTTPEDWQNRRHDILRNFQLAAGNLPSPVSRVPLDLKVLEEVRLDPPAVRQSLIRKKISFQSDPYDRVPAWLFIPVSAEDGDTRPVVTGAEKPRHGIPAVLCLQQTTNAGKNEPAGIEGDPSMKYAIELAERGLITLAPDYPSFGEHAYDFDGDRYRSGTMKAIWDNIRAVDVLQSLPQADPVRIGCIGHSLGGHNAIFTAAFEPRLVVIVSSCGFTSLRKDDLPSWTGPRYMPQIASQFQNDITKVPFDFHELVAVIAPRPFLACAATLDSDFDVSGVRDVITAAQRVYAIHSSDDRLASLYPEAPHSFPAETRQQAYDFLIRHLSEP